VIGEQEEELPRQSWRGTLDLLTKEHEGDDITIEIVSEEFGDLVEVERMPLAYLQYDHKDDTFIVAVGGGRNSRYPVVLHHIISHPKAIRRVPPRSPGATHAINVVGPEGDETLVTLHRRAGA
jgi:hypothetical protein